MAAVPSPAHPLHLPLGPQVPTPHPSAARWLHCLRRPPARVCVCVCVCARVCVCMRARMCAHACMNMYACVCVHGAYMSERACVWVHVCVHAWLLT